MAEKINFIVAKNDFETFAMHAILGTTGAAMETEMNFFFTFWGLKILQKKFKPKVSGMPWPMKRLAAWMFKKKLKSFGYDDIWEMIEDGVKDGKIKLYPCSMTMDLMMPKITRKSLRTFVEEPVGAAKFLEMCDANSKVIAL